MSGHPLLPVPAQSEAPGNKTLIEAWVCSLGESELPSSTAPKLFPTPTASSSFESLPWAAETLLTICLCWLRPWLGLSGEKSKGPQCSIWKCSLVCSVLAFHV